MMVDSARRKNPFVNECPRDEYVSDSLRGELPAFWKQKYRDVTSAAMEVDLCGLEIWTPRVPNLGSLLENGAHAQCQ